MKSSEESEAIGFLPKLTQMQRESKASIQNSEMGHQLQGASARFQTAGSLSDQLDQISDMLFSPSSDEFQNPRAAFHTLFRSLVLTLDLDYVCLRAGQDALQTFIEVASDGTAADLEQETTSKVLGYASLYGSRSAVQHPAPRLPLQKIFQFPFVIDDIRGVVIAGASRDSFPTPVEQLVLEFAARKVTKKLRGSVGEETPFDASTLDGFLTSKPSYHLVGSLTDEIVRALGSPPSIVSQANHQVRQMLDWVPVMAWSSFPDGTCEFLNKVHFEYTGISFEQSRHLGWQAAMHPDDLNHRMDKWRESIATGKPSEAEVRIRRHDGVYRWFSLRLEPCIDQFGTIVRWYGAGTDIEDRKRAEASLSASEKKLSLVFNTIPMLILSCLPDGTADFFNEQWCTYTGFSVERSEGWGWASAIHSDDFQHTMDYWCAILLSDGQDHGAFETRFRRIDGEYRWFWVRTTAVLDDATAIKRWYVTISDIHDRKLAEESVRRSDTLLAEAQRLAGLGIFSCRTDCEEMSWCPALSRMFGFPPGIPITRAMVAKRTHPDDAPFVFGKIGSETPVRDIEEQLRIVMPDGSTKYIRYCAYATTTVGGDTEYIGTVQDVTERHLAAQALDQARAELAKVSKESSLSVLTASIAHEVNQPLSGIVMNANTCLRMLSMTQPNIAGAIETAQRTIRDGNRAASVVSRLRKLFSEKAITATAWDIADVSREVVELLKEELRKNKIKLEEVHDKNLPLVRGDKIQIQQVIFNLLRNAIEAIVAASHGAKRIEIGIFRRDEMVYISVKDSGIGFDVAAADNLFETFYSTKKDGMGIGLSISRRIVEAHGGTLSVSINDEGGATFAFSIPYDAEINTHGHDVFSEKAHPTP